MSVWLLLISVFVTDFRILHHCRLLPAAWWPAGCKDASLLLTGIITATQFLLLNLVLIICLSGYIDGNNQYHSIFVPVSMNYCNGCHCSNVTVLTLWVWSCKYWSWSFNQSFSFIPSLHSCLDVTELSDSYKFVIKKSHSSLWHCLK